MSRKLLVLAATLTLTACAHREPTPADFLEMDRPQVEKALTKMGYRAFGDSDANEFRAYKDTRPFLGFVTTTYVAHFTFTPLGGVDELTFSKHLTGL